MLKIGLKVMKLQLDSFQHLTWPHEMCHRHYLLVGGEEYI